MERNKDNESEQRTGLQKDRFKRKRTERKKDYETEQCTGCKGFFLKGRGLKIHQTKTGCLRKTEKHRKAHKSEATQVQDNNHSDRGGRVYQDHGVGEFETLDNPQNMEEKMESDGMADEEGQGKMERSTQDRKEEKLVEEETEVHIGEELYNEVQAWVEEEIGTLDLPVLERQRKKREDSSLTTNQPKLNRWFGQDRGSEDLQKAEHAPERIIPPKKSLHSGHKSREREQGQQDIRKVLLEKGAKKMKDKKTEKEPQERKTASKSAQQDIRQILIKDKEDKEEKTRQVLIKDLEDEEEKRSQAADLHGKTAEGPWEKDVRTVLLSEQEESEAKPKIEESKGLEEEEMERLIASISNGDKREELVNHWLSLNKEDFRSLQGKEYINDKIIDSYMRLIQERSQSNPNLPSTYACSTFLFTKLKSLGVEEGYKQTRNWFKEDLRSKDIILFPIGMMDHWSLILVEVKTKTIHYLDSLIGSRRSSPAPGIIRKFMEVYYRDKGEAGKFKVKVRADAPVQGNGFDCGVFTCTYAERLSKGDRLDFRQGNLAQARSWMTRELLNGKLNPERDWLQGKQSVSKTKKEKSEEKKKQGGLIQKEKPKEEVGDGDRRGRVNWPRASSKMWKDWGESMEEMLKAQNLSPENQSVVHPTLIYTFGKERFGIKEKRAEKETHTRGPSRRQRKCTRLREEINKLKEAYANAGEDQKDGIGQLQSEKLRQLRITKRAESIRKNRQKFVKNCNKFLSQPFDFAREVISPRPRGDIASSKQETEEHLKRAHGDKGSNQDKDAPEDLHQYEEPATDFDDSLPTWKEFDERLRKARNSSAPGPNGVPYLVYKRCPGLARLLWLNIRGMWRKNAVSRAWREAEGVFIPKEDGAKEVGKFRTISLLNVEGKLFFALKAKRLVNYALANKFIDTSIQKGGIPEVSGCLEHTALLSQLIREAKAGKGNLVVTWLDIANAYGSMPHSLILIALERIHVPERVIQLVKSYYADVKIRFSAKKFTTEWQKVEKGIITGCTISVILFAIAMTMLVMSVRKETKGPKTATGQEQKNTRLFMDDIATTTGNLVQTKYLLDKLMAKFQWADLSIKPEKCRSLVIIKGEVSKKTPEIDGTPITSITEKQVKYLGKAYDKSLGDREQVEEVIKEVKSSLRKIERCRVPGRYKAWILQHMMLPKLMWPLTIYNVPLSKVGQIQRLLTAKLKKWLGLPRSLSEACLYSKTSKLQLPYSELTEEFIAAKTRLLVTLQGTEDQCVRLAGINIDGGKKADTQATITEAEERLRTQEITGIPNKGREGIGMKPRKYFSKEGKKEKRRMVVNTAREMEEEKRVVRMAGLRKQGAPMNWEVPERKISSMEVVGMQENRLGYLVKSVYDLLPTPENRSRWFGTEERCQLCGGVGTMAHILCGCPTALGQGRYRWRHDQVLREIAHHVEEKRKESNNSPATRTPYIAFVKAGEKKTGSTETGARSYLDGQTDWRLQVDLDKRLKVPEEIAPTDLRPDLILISDSGKKMGVMELTVPNEDRVEVSNEIKRSKYAVLQVEGKKRGWSVQVWAVEVGCRGFPAGSLPTFFKDLGITGGKRRRAIRKVGEAAERASRWIWRRSGNREWGGVR